MRWLVLLTAFALLQPTQAATQALPGGPFRCPARRRTSSVDAPQSFDDWLTGAHRGGPRPASATGSSKKPWPDSSPSNGSSRATAVRPSSIPASPDTRAPASRRSMINRGRDLTAEHKTLLDEIEKKFGVQRPLPGRHLGYGIPLRPRAWADPVFQALATLAWEPRRAAFFRGELFNALTMVQRGHIEAQTMTGSWAGAMGQTQFMPSSYLKFAVDFDGDDRRDIWKSTPDALASIANYLRGSGGRRRDLGTRGRGQRRCAGQRSPSRSRSARKAATRSQHDRASSARGSGRSSASAADGGRSRRPTSAGLVDVGERKFLVYSELRCDPRLQLRALLRAHRRSVG